MSSTPTALSLFSGIGGLDLGATIAGVNVLLATDVDSGALEVLHERTGMRTLHGDVDELLEGRLVDAWGRGNRPALIIGGPPCTGFSHAGFWISDKRRGADPAVAYLASYAKAVTTFRPDAFVLENVPGLTFKTHVAFLNAFLSSVRRAGYTAFTEVLDASEFGVAQARRRLFVVGFRSSRRPRLNRRPVFPMRSAAWAIGELADTGLCEPDELPGGKYRELLELVPPGGNYLAFTRERNIPGRPVLFRNRGRYWSFLLKIDPKQPAPTLPAQRLTYNGPFHWRNRHLRVGEIARLQSFPDEYPITSSLKVARRQLGNAVPPLLAAVVLWQVRAVLEGAQPALPSALALSLDSASSYRDVMGAYPMLTGQSSRKAVA